MMEMVDSSRSTGGDSGDSLIGRVVGSRYRLEKRVGAGAMGAVYKARHVKIDRAFAVKVLHVDLLEDQKLKRRFVREAELSGTLSHPNVVKVVDVGETLEGLHYIVMEFAEGPTLGEIMTQHAPLPTARVIDLATQICDGLHHAHERGLIHRDFKPDNVIVESLKGGKEMARIVDFGIAIVRDDASNEQRERLTTAGITLGTPHYMAPEHVTGQAIDHRIDLFALGVVLYEALCGKMPFDGDGVDVARANLLEETPYMAERAPTLTIDPLLEAFVRKLLSKAPDARPATAKAARELLDMIVRDRPRAAAALGVLIQDVPPVTPPPIVRVVPRYATYTPPTPMLAVPQPITYSPSGQHAIVGDTTIAGESQDPTGPVQVADRAQALSASQRTRAARVSQTPMPRPATGSTPPLTRDASAPGSTPPLSRDASAPGSTPPLSRDASAPGSTAPLADPARDPAAPFPISPRGSSGHAADQSPPQPIAAPSSSAQPAGAPAPIAAPSSSAQPSSAPAPTAAPRARTESVKRRALRIHRMWIAIALGAIALGGALAFLLR